jgi:hypothetical protein
MFGMLEFVTKEQDDAKFDRYENLSPKGEQIKRFMERNLSDKLKEGIVSRYSIEEIFKSKKKIETFSDVIDHLWFNIRSGFIHDLGLEFKGLDYDTLVGMGTEDDPIRSKRDVPMQEWLQITWQAILSSYGYKGLVRIVDK